MGGFVGRSLLQWGPAPVTDGLEFTGILREVFLSNCHFAVCRQLFKFWHVHLIGKYNANTGSPCSIYTPYNPARITRLSNAESAYLSVFVFIIWDRRS